MKRFLSIAALSAITLGFTACQNSEAEKQAAINMAHQKTIDSMRIELVKQQVVDSLQNVAAAIERDRAADSAAKAAVVPTAAALVPAAKNVKIAPAVARTTKKAPARRAKTRSNQGTYSNNGGYANNGGYSNAPAPVYEPAPAPVRKKGWAGWSAKAKGAVIGAGTGAVGGAIINKRNRAAGAVIGGVGGAAIGTGIGAVIDRKNGR